MISEPTTPHPPGPPAAAFVVVGTARFPIEADRIHVLGSGERADVRIVHGSVAAAHLTLCAHQGRLIVEDLGAPGGTWLGDEQIVGERDVAGGALLRLGAIPIALELGAAPVANAGGTPPTPHRGEPTFGELMADELRRAPWFGLSLLLHAVLFLALYLLLPSTPRVIQRIARIDLTTDDGTGTAVDAESIPEPEIVVPEPADPFETLPDAVVEPVDPEPAENTPESSLTPSELEGVAELGASMFARVGGGTGHGDVLGGAGGGTTADFRRTIAGLRSSGLEIMFVVDSTGSMGPVLEATKRRMARMLETLHVLVPDARIGIVTYRDVGQNEEYLTRTVPLDRDLYRSLNFMQTVTAGGGGDRPEAVLEGLRDAAEQRWRKGARRVIVLIGDAPAHDFAVRELDQIVRRFVDAGSSFVHTIMTSTDLFGAVAGDTRTSFERIARLGKGLCVSNEREDQILEEVLSLAIGNEHRASLAEVFRRVEERDANPSTLIRDLVRRADPEALERELRRDTVDDDLVRQLGASGSRNVANALLQILRSPDLPDSGRHAAAHALQRMLGLRTPPIDPSNPAPLDDRTYRELRTTAASLLK